MDKSELLAEAVARAWVDSPSIALTAVDELGPDLVHALRKLESTPAAAAEPVQAEILSLLKPFPSFEKRVRDEINVLRLLDERESARPAVDVSYRARHYRHSVIEVAYATDRQPSGKSDLRDWYGSDRGELSFGIVQVSIPDDHRMGRLDKPRAWPLGFREDRLRHLGVAGLTPSDPIRDIPFMATLLRRAPESEILVFIHGYNVSFADAACRTAQIAYDLDFKGSPFLYSWPSNASTLSYFVDGENAQWSQQNFSEFLDVAITSFGCTRIHVLAHSMGNRILTETLTSLETAAFPIGSAQLGQVVFAAPDIDSDVFAHRAKKFVGRADRFTLYVSDKDQALNISQRLAKYPRAGQAGADIVVLDGVDTIDASDLDTGLMSHSYVGTHRSVISDLYYLIHRGALPDERFGLRPVVTSAGIHWTFRR